MAMSVLSDRDAEHQQRGLDDDRHGCSADALVDDALDQPGDGQVKEDHDNQGNQRKKGELPVRFNEVDQFTQMVH